MVFRSQLIPRQCRCVEEKKVWCRPSRPVVDEFCLELVLAEQSLEQAVGHGSQSQ
jgi:hypothetical protein